MPPGDGITQDEMIRQTWVILCQSTPGKPSLCDRVAGLESNLHDIQAARAKEEKPTAWQRFANAALQGAGGATGAVAVAALLLGLAFKFNADAAIAANRFQPREAQRATP